ncbi:Hypothetical Protein FCC1311_107282 [Hondaea fermentalgiana]|uniref:Uncharacterized protein n=1 Tax=Hondaea fermentalgiana TaxID=2315210 RepID=A0A2R5H293_9STRA|nr:Hypothetical Protein FCC1311_107282 [Hondaea fermentalgiana]|eukprot:GBG34504.1 Hypothetical Protein FCC1311_107282 [Hondaea fermentalgiana]
MNARSESRALVRKSGVARRASKQRSSEAFHKTASDLGNTVEVLRGQLKELQREIRADRVGKKEFEDEIAMLMRRREKIEKNLADNAAWAREFDSAIGPFERTYAGLTHEISGLYDNAKEEHAKGVQVLIDQFNYHPAFKRWNETFFAIPFRPK